MMNSKPRGMASLLAAAMIASFGAAMASSGRVIGDEAPKPTRHKQAARRRGTRKNRKSTLHTTNGVRECARRMRQIASGMLKVTA